MAEAGTSVTKAADILRRGGLVAIPTETVYGLAANALNESAIAKVFSVKERPFFDPLIVHCASLEQAEELGQFNHLARKLAKAFWPGPLTLIVEKFPIIPDLATSGLPKVGLRMPNHQLTLELLHLLEFPLVAPSANPFGYISPTTAEHVETHLGHRVDYILDGGPCLLGIESTIIDCSSSSPVILRLGALSKEKIEGLIGKTESMLSNSSPTAPGQLLAHYAPRVPLEIMDELPEAGDRNCGYLSFSHLVSGGGWAGALSAKRDIQEAATNLFRLMREADNAQISKLYAEFVPDFGIGRAINDRLKRAAHR